MNIFRHCFYLNEKPYTVFIDTSNDDFKKIVINNKEIVNEKYLCGLPGHPNIIYYPIDVDGHELIVSIDCTTLNHAYNIYLSDISLLDQTRLSSVATQAKNATEEGFSAFFLKKWLVMLFYSVGMVIAFIIAKSLFTGFFEPKLLFLFLLVPPIMLALVGAEWIEKKSISSNFKKRFRPKASYK